MSVSTLDIALAPAWRPNVGNTLTGAVAHIEKRTTEYGTYPVVYIAKEDTGELFAVHAFHQTLKDGLKELAPQRGEFVSITYAGKKESSKREDSKGEPVEYHHYVVVDPAATVDGTELDWDSPDF
ncbi:MAG: hypothetical protein LC723_06380 [Actinobacteria bacterium]|nr:hypothetical protein [Actinomycetota bacterium]